jgi:hypothetical protein
VLDQHGRRLAKRQGRRLQRLGIFPYRGRRLGRRSRRLIDHLHDGLSRLDILVR